MYCETTQRFEQALEQVAKSCEENDMPFTVNMVDTPCGERQCFIAITPWYLEAFVRKVDNWTLLAGSGCKYTVNHSLPNSVELVNGALMYWCRIKEGTFWYLPVRKEDLAEVERWFYEEEVNVCSVLARKALDRYDKNSHDSKGDLLSEASRYLKMAIDGLSYHTKLKGE